VDTPAERQTLTKLGDAIRVRRNHLGMSQEALADAAKISRTHMGEVERGKRNISFTAVVRIASAVEMSPSELVTAAGL
jgi:transcriptional regulator with XRE-family HTH domain